MFTVYSAVDERFYVRYLFFVVKNCLSMGFVGALEGGGWKGIHSFDE